jgi:hypothetical protein
MKVLARAKVELVVVPGNGGFTPEHQRVVLACKLGGLPVEQCELSMRPLPDAAAPAEFRAVAAS